MGYDVYCPYCKEDFDDDGYWHGDCPSCGKQWSRESYYNRETGEDGEDIIWEGQGQ